MWRTLLSTVSWFAYIVKMCLPLSNVFVHLILDDYYTNVTPPSPGWFSSQDGANISPIPAVRPPAEDEDKENDVDAVPQRSSHFI